MASSIEQAKQLKALLEEQNKLMAQQTEMLKTQMGMMRQMADAVRQMNIDGLGRGIEELNGAVKGAAEAIEGLGTSQQTLGKVNETLEEGADAMDELGKKAEFFGNKLLKLAPVVATFEGMAGGFMLTANAMRSVIKVGSGLISTFFNLSAAVVTLPYKILTGLMSQVGAGSTALREEFENVRKTFGDLSTNEGKALIDSWRSVDHFGGQLAETGISIWRTMGNMAETMAKLREIAEQMGPLFHNFHRQLATGGERIFAYQKGLGLTEDGMRAVTETAQRAGVSFQEVGRHITSTAYAMGDAFGMNGKMISRDIGNMMNDFEHFGSLGVQELAQVSVYARKLGVEIEKLTGALDQFADFDKAAESVAQLSQAFGLQLDTMELVREQDPAANIERLRKAFFAAGRSIETMTRQERALLATQTGLDEKTASLVFSQENQAMSYADIQKQGETSEKQQLSQAEAMEKLANSIERVIKQGQQLKGGFFDIFLTGFGKGFRRTEEFWGVMRNLRRSMRSTFRAGRRVGQLFVKNFPGVKDVLEGIGELFDPRRFRKMLNGVVGAFRNFFKDMTDNPDVALPNLLKRLKESFFSWFDTSTPKGRKIIDGFKTFLKATTQIFANLLKYAIKGLTEVFKGITSFIKGDPIGAVKGAAGEAADGVMGFLAEVFEPLITFFQSSEGRQILSDLWDSFVGMFGAAWDFVKPKIMNFLKENWMTIMGVLFAPAIIGGVVRGLGTALAGGLVKGLASGLGGFMRKAPNMVRGALGQLGSSASPANISAGGENSRAIAGATQGVGQAAKAGRTVNISMRDVGNMTLIALFITAGLILVAVALYQLAKKIEENNISTQSILGSAAIMVAAGVVMLELAGVIGILATVGSTLPASAVPIIAGIAVIGAVAAAMAFGVKNLIEYFSDIPEGDITKSLKVMGAASLMFLGAGAMAGVAALVGIGVVGSLGAGALAITAGMATISSVIMKMADTTEEIIGRIGSLRLDAGMDRKIEVFTTVFRAIGSGIGSIAQIMAAASPSFGEVLTDGPTFTEKMRDVNRFVRQVGDVMQELVITLVDQARNLTGIGDEGMKNAEFLARMLSGIGSVVQNLSPPREILESDLLDLAGGDSVGNKLTGFTHYIRIVAGAMEGLIGAVGDMFEGIGKTSGFTKETGAVASAIGEIFTSIGSFVRSISVFMSSQYSGVEPEKLREFAPTLGRITDGILSAIVGTSGNNIFSRMVGTIKAVVSQIGDLDEGQLRALKAATPIMDATFTTMNAIAALVGNVGLGDAVKGTPEQTQEKISQLVGLVTAVTEGLGESIGRIVGSLVEAFKGLRGAEIRRVKSGVGFLGDVFEAVGQFPEIATKFQGNSESVEDGFNRMRDFLINFERFLSGSGGTTGVVQFAGRLPVWLNKIGELVQPLGDSIPNFIEVMRLTKGVFTAIGTVFSEEILSTMVQIEGDALTRTKDGVVAMVEHLGEIDEALGRLRVVNIDTRLRELNKSLGLRSTGRLDIREDPIHFHVKFDVHIDAEELENVLIERPNSKFAKFGGGGNP